MRDECSLRRQWSLLRMLGARRFGVTVREMAQEMGVSPKTIRRDLELFRGVGFCLEETTGDFGRKTWRLGPASSLVALSFTHEEAAALYLGRRLLDPLAGTVFWLAAQQAYQKVRAGLSDRVVRYLERFSCFFHHALTGIADYSAKSELIDALVRACEESKATHILYQSDRATEPAFRDVYPYGVFLHKPWLYLAALDPQEDKIKHYKVDRIEQVEVSEFPFRRPEDFNLADHLAATFGIYHSNGAPVTVKVRFAPAVARYVQEAKWHPSQVLTKQRDGSLLARYELASTAQFQSWVLSFGSKAVVLEPEELREEIAEELRAMMATYSVGGADRAAPASRVADRGPSMRGSRAHAEGTKSGA
jgi:proteasome accessory factor B